MGSHDESEGSQDDWKDRIEKEKKVATQNKVHYSFFCVFWENTG